VPREEELAELRLRRELAVQMGGAEQVADLVFRRVGDAVADAGPGFDEGRVAEFAA